MAVDTTPQFAIADAVAFAREAYGFTVTASPLPSERDQNFALDAVGGEKYILKIAKSDEERAVLELQTAALTHAAERAPDLALPRLVPAACGENMATIRNQHGKPYFVRLLTWLHGEIFVHALPHDAALLASLGAVVGEVDRALQGFSHRAMHRELYWDVKRADLALEHLSLLPIEQQSLVRHFMHAWRGVEWKALRHSLIHGDANDYNVLVREGRVVGSISETWCTRPSFVIWLLRSPTRCSISRIRWQLRFLSSVHTTVGSPLRSLNSTLCIPS